jgi:hypothetical protein
MLFCKAFFPEVPFLLCTSQLTQLRGIEKRLKEMLVSIVMIAQAPSKGCPKLLTFDTLADGINFTIAAQVACVTDPAQSYVCRIIYALAFLGQPSEPIREDPSSSAWWAVGCSRTLRAIMQEWRYGSRQQSSFAEKHKA